MLKGTNFNLRHVARSDLDKLASLMNDLGLRGEYVPAMMFSPEFLGRLFNETSLSSDERETLLIVDNDNRILGTVTHFKSTPYYSALEVGYNMYSLEHRGRGIATEAVRLVTNYLFKVKTINRLEIRMVVNNIASERVAGKCGYVKEGVARGANFVNGKFVDMNVYALLRNEWELQAKSAAGTGG